MQCTCHWFSCDSWRPKGARHVWMSGISLASPPPSAPYFSHSLPVSFSSRNFLETPVTQATAPSVHFLYFISHTSVHPRNTTVEVNQKTYNLMKWLFTFARDVHRLRGGCARLRIKAETHDATNRGDTSQRQVASSALLLRQVACA